MDLYPHWFHAYDMLLPFTRKSREAVRRFEERYLYATEHYYAPERIPPSLSTKIDPHPTGPNYGC